ncbi:hypothetical protein E3Q13_02964 [Wallemia mellicola]|nr:hypothetical protein E3Q13_02964 [Wallemia mellicola]
MPKQHIRTALLAAFNLRSLSSPWRNRLSKLLDEHSTKKRVMLYGKDTKKLTEALLIDPLTDDARSVQVLEQRYNLGGRRNQGELWTIKHNESISTPSTELVLIPLRALQDVDIVECLESLPEEEALDEAVLSHQLIIQSDASTSKLVDQFKYRPLTTLLDKNLNVADARKALDLLNDGDYNGYTNLMTSSNIQALKQDYRLTHNDDDRARHAIILALKDSNKTLDGRYQNTSEILDEERENITQIDTLYTKFLRQTPSLEAIQNDKEQSLQKSLEYFQKTPFYYLPIKADDVGASLEQSINSNFARSLELDLAAVDSQYNSTKSAAREISREHLTRAAEKGMTTAIASNKLEESIRNDDYKLKTTNICRAARKNLTTVGSIPDMIALMVEKSLTRSYVTVVASAGLGYSGMVADILSSGTAVGLTTLGAAIAVRNVQKMWKKAQKTFTESWDRAYKLIEFDYQETLQKEAKDGVLRDVKLSNQLTSEWVNTERERLEELNKEIETVRRTFLLVMPSSTKSSVGKADKAKKPAAEPKSILKNKKSDEVEEPSSEDDDEGEEGDEEVESDDENDSDEAPTTDYESDYNGLQKKPKKRKRNEGEAFAEALSNLAEADSKKLEILPAANKSLKKHKLTLKAQKVLRDEAKSDQDIGRLRDVVSGWAVPSAKKDKLDDESALVDAGAEKEKRLRKVAQKGVVKLFNAILAAQKAESGAKVSEKEKDKGIGRARLEAPANFPRENKGKKNNDNVAKNAFMDAIRKG